MKFSDVMRGHLHLTETELAEIWASAVICLDTNVLLNVYRYGAESRKEFLRLLASIKSRLFVPHRVAEEFARNRAKVIRDQNNPIAELLKIFDKAVHHVEQIQKRHPKRETLIQAVAEAKALVENKVTNDADECESLVRNDTIYPQLLEVIGDDVGEPVGEDHLRSEYARRKTDLIPPFCTSDDKEKDAINRTGDVAIWLELLKQLEQDKKPLIFVTNDKKSNWWADFGNNTQAAQPSLTQEMFRCSGQPLLLYSAEGFIVSAPTKLGIRLDQNVAEETRSINEEQADAIATRDSIDEFLKRFAKQSDPDFDPTISVYADEERQKAIARRNRVQGRRQAAIRLLQRTFGVDPLRAEQAPLKRDGTPPEKPWTKVPYNPRRPAKHAATTWPDSWHTGNRIVVHGWRKLLVKKGGKAKRWAVIEREITKEDFGQEDEIGTESQSETTAA